MASTAARGVALTVAADRDFAAARNRPRRRGDFAAAWAPGVELDQLARPRPLGHGPGRRRWPLTSALVFVGRRRERARAADLEFLGRWWPTDTARRIMTSLRFKKPARARSAAVAAAFGEPDEAEELAKTQSYFDSGTATSTKSFVRAAAAGAAAGSTRAPARRELQKRTNPASMAYAWYWRRAWFWRRVGTRWGGTFRPARRGRPAGPARRDTTPARGAAARRRRWTRCSPSSRRRR